MTPTIIGELFDNMLAMPGLTRNFRLFFRLHVRPIRSILNLIGPNSEYPDSTATSFQRFGLLLYLGVILLPLSLDNLPSNTVQRFEIPLAILLAISVFGANLISYAVLSRAVNKRKSFLQFMKMMAYLQGMFFSYSALLILLSVGLSNVHFENIKIILVLLVMIYLCYYSIVALRTSRRFWGLGWGRFLVFQSLAGLLSSVFSIVLFVGFIYLLQILGLAN